MNEIVDAAAPTHHASIRQSSEFSATAEMADAIYEYALNEHVSAAAAVIRYNQYLGDWRGRTAIRSKHHYHWLRCIRVNSTNRACRAHSRPQCRRTELFQKQRNMPRSCPDAYARWAAHSPGNTISTSQSIHHSWRTHKADQKQPLDNSCVIFYDITHLICKKSTSSDLYPYLALD